MTLHVDREACQVTGVCTGLAPEVLELDERGELVVLDRTPPPDLLDDVRQAVRSCPVRAPWITED
ncbi:ferredoxin [Streptomyces antioxidans]|uniref:Ferredoxin n=1 Tax=Streptomyces antioxidans TaxID=1507734 RepID=A0A1V4CYQ1_9ACTN|nr:ferredoxin [Streptomyces antioxidans]OPF74038.1 ferredoxin [Streptomyces antioxidans]